MIATYINAVSIIIGSLLGLLIRGRLSEKFKEVVFSASGLVTLTIGLSMAMQTGSYLVLLFSLVLGGFIGYLIGIEDGILRFGDWIEKRSSRKVSSEGRHRRIGLCQGFPQFICSVLFRSHGRGRFDKCGNGGRL